MMDLEKVCTIKNWPRSQKIKDMQAFLGFANFYRRFINSYSELASSLTQLIWKGSNWDWTQDCQCTFDTLKEAFLSAPILAHWTPEASLISETDASDHMIAVILLMLL